MVEIKSNKGDVTAKLTGRLSEIQTDLAFAVYSAVEQIAKAHEGSFELEFAALITSVKMIKVGRDESNVQSRMY